VVLRSTGPSQQNGTSSAGSARRFYPVRSSFAGDWQRGWRVYICAAVRTLPVPLLALQFLPGAGGPREKKERSTDSQNRNGSPAVLQQASKDTAMSTPSRSFRYLLEIEGSVNFFIAQRISTSRNGSPALQYGCI
jgi:hypothetical protein